MAAAGSLDDLLNSKVDESAFSALVGTLEDQLYSGQTQSASSTGSGASSVVANASAGPSVAGAAVGDGRVPANGAQLGVVSGNDLNRSLSANVPRTAVVTSAGLRTVSAHSQAGVIQTGHFPPNSQTSNIVGSAGNPGSNVVKVVQASGPHSSSLGTSYAVNTNLSNGASSQGTTANGKNPLGSRVVNVAPGTPTVIVNKQGGLAGTVAGVSSALTSGVQVVNVNQAQVQSSTMQKTLAPRIVLSSQSLNRTTTPGQPLTLQSLQNSGSGHILVRTETGQLKLLQLPVQGGAASGNVSSVGGLQPAAAAAQKTPAPTQPRTVSAAPVPAAAAAAQPAPAAAQPQQGAMAPDTAKVKCKNFLATLLKLARDQPATVAQNVRNLIQNLIDGRVEPEAFTTRLQQELNSSPQPCLVPFLKKSLPFLRQSLYSREITIDGVKPPPPSALPTPLGTVPSMHTQPRQVTVSPAAVTSASPVRLVTQPRNVTSGHPALLSIQPFQSGTKVVRTPSSASASSSPVTVVTHRQPPVIAVKKEAKRQQFKTSQLESGPDDDINDVAAMGGVNVQEESQHIQGAGRVGTLVRSVRDDTFLHRGPLQLRVRQIAMKHGLEEPPAEVVSLVSHATQERLKSLLERLAIIAEHRLDVIKTEPRYEASRDVRAQLRFLEELDKLEQKRHEETEREMLMRAAKSRSKTEDPEQAKLKAKAKELQRMEMEEVRQREANLTALNAIGPRKKPRIDGETPASTDGPTVSGLLSQKQIPVRPRVKRVNVRDMLHLLEQERDQQRSGRLYRLYGK